MNFSTDLPSWIRTYGLYKGDPRGEAATNVGYGTYGGGVGPTGFDFGRRWGTNVVDYINFDSQYADYLDLYTDFDDPAGAFDAFCALGIACTPHLFTEAGTAEGDSGGPLSIDGKIAGVTSFGTYLCLDDPPRGVPCTGYVADQTRPTDSFGSLHGFAPVFANVDFIESSVAPEPASLALMGTGLVVVGGVARRRRRGGARGSAA